ncbi:MAG: glycoside hydrolase family 16 protein [Burkholderiales bacterium]|nr:glycoside hydrolase family 16 protein [Burkholderiales bacterium]
MTRRTVLSCLVGGVLAGCGGGGGGSAAPTPSPATTPTPTPAPTPTPSASWKLVWSDEFDGTSVDTTKWGYDVGGDGWGNNELEYYTDGANVSVANSVLTIEARQEAMGGRNYTSTRMLTKGKAFWTFGKIEARIKLPQGKGMWPAFWLLGENIDTAGYPACGEIDVMEMVGGTDANGTNNDAIVWGSLHRPDEATNPPATVKSLTAEFINPGNVPFSNDFHVFGIEWNATTMSYYVDGVVYETVDISSKTDGFEVFQRPFFVILNLAVGGDWPGAPDATTVFPQQMLVDWVRVYQQSA